MAETLGREEALNQFWNALASGSEASATAGLDSGDQAVVLLLQCAAGNSSAGAAPETVWPTVLARIMSDVEASGTRQRPPTPSTAAPSFVRNEQLLAELSVRRPVAALFRTRALNGLATALLLIAMAAALLTLTQALPDRGERAPGLPALIGVTSKAQGITADVPLDEAVAALPAGPVQLIAGEVRLQPGVVMREPPLAGVVLLNVAQGAVAVTTSGREVRVNAGERMTRPIDGELTIGSAGEDEAIFLEAFVLGATTTGGRPNTFQGRFSVPGGGTEFWPIAVGADLPASPGWITLERVTLEPGAVLPPFEASGLDWVAPLAGRVGITAVGEHLPFRWKSGAERVYAAHDRDMPRFATGTRITLRNAGEIPLVILRLAVTSLAGITASR